MLRFLNPAIEGEVLTFHIKNEELIQSMRKTLEIMKTVKASKKGCFGHIMRSEKYPLLQLIMQDNLDGKRGPGRRRTSWLKNLRQWQERHQKTSSDQRSTELDEPRWARVIANVHLVYGT